MDFKSLAHVLLGKEEDERIEICDGMVIGRNDECTVRFRDSRVSGQHLKLFLREGKVYVVDLKSHNKTEINGKAISSGKEHLLQPEDVLGFGKQNFTYKVEERTNKVIDIGFKPKPRESKPEAKPPASVVSREEATRQHVLGLLDRIEKLKNRSSADGISLNNLPAGSIQFEVLHSAMEIGSGAAVVDALRGSGDQLDRNKLSDMGPNTIVKEMNRQREYLKSLKDQKSRLVKGIESIAKLEQEFEQVDDKKHELSGILNTKEISQMDKKYKSLLEISELIQKLIEDKEELEAELKEYVEYLNLASQRLQLEQEIKKVREMGFEKEGRELDQKLAEGMRYFRVLEAKFSKIGGKSGQSQPVVMKSVKRKEKG